MRHRRCSSPPWSQKIWSKTSQQKIPYLMVSVPTLHLLQLNWMAVRRISSVASLTRLPASLSLAPASMRSKSMWTWTNATVSNSHRYLNVKAHVPAEYARSWVHRFCHVWQAEILKPRKARFGYHLASILKIRLIFLIIWVHWELIREYVQSVQLAVTVISSLSRSAPS